MVSTLEYAARKRGLERNFMAGPFLDEEVAGEAASIQMADNAQALYCSRNRNTNLKN
jgi:hypothetical protein